MKKAMYCLLLFYLAFSHLAFSQTPPTIDGDCALCTGIVYTFSTTPGKTNYVWTVGSGIIASGQGTHKITASWNTPGPATVTVKYDENPNTGSISPNVSPIPTIDPIPPTIGCSGQLVSIPLSGSVPNATYNWSVSGDHIGLSNGSSSNEISFSAISGITNSVNATVKVTPSVLSCQGNSETFTITIHPEATVSLTGPAAICKGETVNLTFTLTGAAPWNVVYSDGVTQYPITIINSPHNEPVSPTASTTYQVVSAEDANGCIAGNKPSLYIEVLALPEITNVFSDYTLCTGEEFEGLTFTGDFTSFEWENTGDPINGLPSGVQTGHIITTRLINTDGSRPETAKITVRAFNTNNGVTCETVYVDAFSITVLPTPRVSGLHDMYYCNGEVVKQYDFQGTGNSYKWKYKDGAAFVGLGVTGGEDFIPEFTATNSGGTSIMANYEAKAYLTVNGKTCEGNTQSFSIAAGPLLEVRLEKSELFYCTDMQAPTYPLKASIDKDLLFVWEMQPGGDDIGGLTDDMGLALPPFTTAHTELDMLSATYDISVLHTGSLKTCQSEPSELTINILPKPTVYPVESKTYCANTFVEDIVFNGGLQSEHVLYRWKLLGGDPIGSQTSGDNVLPAFTTENNTLYPIKASYMVTPVFKAKDIPEALCEGEPEYFDITVTPNPNFTSPLYAGVICSGDVLNYTAATDAQEVSFSWMRPAIEGINDGTSGVGHGEIINETLHNNGLEVITVPYTFTVGYEGCMVQKVVTVDVYPAPQLSAASSVLACRREEEVAIPYETAMKSLLKYKILFSAGAQSAGFIDIAPFKSLPAEDIFRVPLPQNVQHGRYTGEIVVQAGDCNPKSYPFEIGIAGAAQILWQTSGELFVCEGSLLNLDVTVDETGLSYQWFKESGGEYGPIPGATASSYAVFKTTANDYGSYFVEIEGLCGSTNSTPVLVRPGTLTIYQRSKQELFVESESGTIVAYQWYQIDEEGTPHLLPGVVQEKLVTTDKNLSGIFAVQVVYANNKTEMSCPFIVDNSSPSNTMTVYPNPVASNGKIHITIDIRPEEIFGAQIYLFSPIGQTILAHPITGSSMTIAIPELSSGIYLLNLRTTIGRTISAKVIVY